MDIRNGKCFDCGAEYKIPATFPHDVARCKECGKAVHVAQVGEPMPSPPAKAAPPAPAKKVAPRAAAKPQVEEYVPSGKKGEGPSMMERLRAERAAAAGGAAGAAAAGKPAAKPSAATLSKRAAGAQRAAGAKSAPKRAAGARAAGSGAGAKRRSSRDAGDGKKRAERGPRQKPEKKAPVLAIVAAVVIVGGGATAFLMKDKLFGESDPVEASGTENVAENDAATSADGDATVPTTSTDDGADTPVDSDATTDAAADPTSDASTDTTADAGDGDADEGGTTAADAPVDEGPDTTLLADIAPILGATADEMAAMDKLMATWMDPWAGRAGSRARDELVNDYSYKALPSMINAMKMLDLSTEEGHRNGDLVQKTFQELFFGKNFEWRYPDSAADTYVAFNRKVVRSWHIQIAKIAENGIEYVIKMADLEKRAKDSDEYADPDRAKIAAQLRAKFVDGAAAPQDDDDDFDLEVD